MEKKIITVFLADDTLIAREGWRAILETEENIDIIGETDTASEVPRKINELSPDILLMDLKWSGDSEAGWTTIQKVRAMNKEVKIIAITAYEELIKNARKAGADAALTKTFTKKQLLNTIEELAGHGDQPPPSYSPIETDYQEPLSDREMEVLRLLVLGKTNKEMADTLVISENTIKNHVRSILSKLDVSNRTGAADKARKLNLLE